MRIRGNQGCDIWTLAIAIAAVFGGTGCSSTPLAPVDVPHTAVKLEGSFESRSDVELQAGGHMYLVQVNFDRAERADGRTYMAQVATSEGSSGSTVLLQQTYARTGDSIQFAGELLGPGQLAGDELRTVVRLKGESIPVLLHRKAP